MSRQVKLGPSELWHRPHDDNGGNYTVCDLEITGPIASRDGYGNGLNLCPECFTRRERDNVKMWQVAREALRAAEADAWFEDDFEEKTDPGITVIPNDHTRDKKK